ncbi:hypothetical protein HOY80DRAFT_1048643 [Tuber brumale]|nr:hypothetical protein HOY80DRAFT_1048643 [Tuber brumale]
MAPSSWSPSPASLHSVYSVLSALDHPLIMVGKYSLNWMGIPVFASHTMDILVRNSQVASIHQAFVQTGEWLGVDGSTMQTFLMGGDLPEYRSVQRLKRYNESLYINLCTEESYRISVDTEKVQVPHFLTFNSALVESEFHPNASDRTVKPYLLTDENIKFVGDPPIIFPIFIPTIPEYIDSCLDIIHDRDYVKLKSHLLPQMDMGYVEHRLRALPQMDIDLFARYLVLSLPHQQDKLLAKVKNRKQLAEFFIEGERRQERRIKRITERWAKRAGDSKPPLVIPPQFRDWTR